MKPNIGVDETICNAVNVDKIALLDDLCGASLLGFGKH